MPNVQQALSVDSLRHTEYYGMQQTYDDLYRESKNGERFPKLMDFVLSRENILLVYRNIKANIGSNTPGTDHQTIKDIGCLSTEEIEDKVRKIVNGKNGYHPKPVRRKEIPKPNGSTRPLGIPCIWDRLIQQCIKQVMEPICQAKFSGNSAVTQWLTKRLKLEVSEEKTGIINAKRRYSEFLGFKVKVHPKAGKQVVVSHICDKRLQAEREKLANQAKQIVRPRHGKTELDEIRIYNSMVMGIHEYYKIATAVNLDYRLLHRTVMTVQQAQNSNRKPIGQDRT